LPKNKSAERKPPYPTCPSSQFKVDGLVGYVQPYDAKTGEYAMSKMIWDEDIATGARCAGCEKDATDLFKQFDILAFYTLELHDR